MSVYALLIDFNKIKKKTLQSGSARQVLFIVLRKFLSSVDFLHVNVGQFIISASIFSLIQAGCPPYTITLHVYLHFSYQTSTKLLP